MIKKLIGKGFDVTSLDNYSTGSKDNELIGATYINDDIENIVKKEEKFPMEFKIFYCCVLIAIQD